MIMWGVRYHVGYPNQIASAISEHSPECTDVLLLTDRNRDGLHPSIRQVQIPDDFMRSKFFKGGYPVKLSLFLTPGIANDTRCVFLDLDTIVLGDLGRIARMVTDHNDVLMLPPAMQTFGPLSRLINRLTNGKRFRTGNSSLVAFSTSASPNIARSFLALHDAQGTEVAAYLKNDDLFISWFAQSNLRAIPSSLAVMLRREFLSRIPGQTAMRAKSRVRSARRKELVAVTLNGIAAKPEALLALPDGATIEDDKGRKGVWGPGGFGPVFDLVRDKLREIERGAGETTVQS